LAKGTTKPRNRENLKKVARLTARVTLVVALVSAMLYGVLLFNNLTTSARTFHLQGVTFQGLEHADEDRLQQLVQQGVSTNVLTVKLSEVRELVEAESWIRAAVVRRRLPNQLEVYVQERIPEAVAAIDGELTIVDAHGVALAPFGLGFEYLDRPILRGLVSSVVEGARALNARRMQVYLQILGELDAGDEDYAGSISEVDVSDVSRVKVIPSQEPVPVLLGDRDYLQRYETFISRMDLVQEVKNKHGRIDWIDVTFDHRIIIHTPREKDQSTVKLLGSD
jgi:cell division septal protein FtsQ